MALVEYFAMTRAVLATINFAGVMSQQRVTGIDRYLRTLELPTEVDGGSPGRRVDRGAIRFDEVTFGYPGRDDVLTGLSLDVPAGEKIALVGASGADIQAALQADAPEVGARTGSQGTARDRPERCPARTCEHPIKRCYTRGQADDRQD